MIFGHGDDSYRYGEKVKIDFSLNLYQKADLGGLYEHLASRISLISHFPEPEAVTLEQMLAEELGIPKNMVMVTAGTTEAIYLIAQLYRGWASIIPQPTFTEYADACKIHDHTVTYYNNDSMEYVPEDRIYWLCNPNNPTGNVMLKELMGHIIRHHPKYIFVVDQSYEDYTLKELFSPHEMTDCHHVLMLHSMSNKYCVPGLRLGYITGSPIILDRLRQLRQPWTVNALAIEAGKYLLQNHVKPIADLEAYMAEAQRLHHELSELDGLMVMDTDTNFMLVHIEHGDVRQLKSWLIEKYGILIRDASNFHGLDSHCFRVAAQTPEEDDQLVSALMEYLAQLKQQAD